MKEIISTLFENLIDTIVITYLLVACLILMILAFILYPFKNIRYFIGYQLLRLVDTMDFFLDKD